MYYQYWVVRYVPDPIRGEFVNIALLVGLDGQDWAFRKVSSLQRATRLGGDPTIANYWLRQLENMVRSLSSQRNPGPEPMLAALSDVGENISAAVVSRLGARLNNAVQISSPYPVVADSAEAGIQMLFDHLVSDPQVQPRELYGAQVYRTVGTELRRRLGGDNRVAIRNRPHIRVGGIPRIANFAVTDSRVEQITNAWSFNLSDVDKVSTEIQAWVAHMHRLRQRGGLLESKSLPPLTIPDDVQLRVIYEEPRHEAAVPALRIAKEVWSEVSNLVAYSNDDRLKVVDDALAVVA